MKRYTQPLAEILKLHGPTAGEDNDGKIIAICELCGSEAVEATGEGAFRWPCPTAAIAHKALNPHISLADAKKDALNKVRTETGFDKTPKPRVGKPGLKAVK